jgi:benzylsuccinate CoA-transferase BbsF subunit
MGSPALAADPRFVTEAQRKANEDALEALVAAWTRRYDRWQLTAWLQAAGVAAFPVEDCKDLVEDGHMDGRGFFVRLPHPEVGVRTLSGIPFKLSETPLAVERPAPCMGEANEYVMREILGRSQEEYEAFVASGVLH